VKIIDLTQTLGPGVRGFSSEPVRTISQGGWNASTLKIYSHSGTHIDAQPHFDAGTMGIDRIPVENFIVDCWLIDLTGIAPKTLISPRDLGKISDKVSSGDGLLLKTGWGKYIGNPEIYRDALPALSEDFVNWCIGSGVRLIGVETPSVSDVNNIPELTRIHTQLLKAGIIIVEGLINLDKISVEKVRFIALPIKIENGDGAPCRAIAIESDNVM
jgi:arylformamidase